MENDTMPRRPRHDPDDPLNAFDRKLVGYERAQIRVPCDMPERLADIHGAIASLAAHLAALSHVHLPARSKALAIKAAVQECEARMQRIGKGRFKQPEEPSARW